MSVNTSLDRHPEDPRQRMPATEADELLNRFLDIASGERTAPTRARYALALDRLRQAEAVAIESASWSLLLRVPVVADAMTSDASDEVEGRRTAASLYERPVRWLVRTTDAGHDDARCLVLEAGAAVQRLRARDVPRFVAQYPLPQYREPLSEARYRYDDAPYGSVGYRYDDVPYASAGYRYDDAPYASAGYRYDDAPYGNVSYRYEESPRENVVPLRHEPRFDER